MENDYKGDFFGFTGGIGWSLIGGFGGGFISVYSPGIQGSGEYKTITGGFSPVPVVSGSMANTFYTFERETYHRYVSGSGYVTEREIRQMQDDIRSGIDSPWFTNIHTHASRQKAIKELEEVWQNHEYFFTFRYRDYQPRFQ